MQQGFNSAVHECSTNLRVRPAMPAGLLADEPIYLLVQTWASLRSCVFPCRADMAREALQWAEKELQHVVKAAILAIGCSSDIH